MQTRSTLGPHPTTARISGPLNACPNCSFASLESFAFCPKCGTKLPEDSTAVSLLGRTLNGKYRIVREVGQGSMGTVFEGEHTSLKKRVAIKVLHADMQLGEESIQRFQREGIAAGQFSHPNAIQIFDFDRDEGPVFYLAMEFVEGLDLKRMIRDDGAQPVDTALSIARQILGALGEAHRHGIVHRDLKPENVMVIRGSGPPRVKVLDFGLSKLLDRPLDASLTEIGRVMGTPLYMSPEQVAGDPVDHRTDLYAVGLILYEMLAGTTPFSGKTLQEILSKHLKELPPSVVELVPELEVPAELDRVLERALEKRREDRFQSAEEMLEALNAVDPAGPLASPASARVRRAATAGTAHGTGAPAAPRMPKALVLALVVLALFPLGLWLTGRLGGGAGAGPKPRQRETPLAERTAAQVAYLGLLDSARADLLAGETQAALSKVQDALRAEVADAEAYLVRGLVYRAKHDTDTARLDFEEALRLDPDYGGAAAELGWMRLDAGESEAALEHFLEAQRIEPGSAEALAGQAAVRLAEGALDDARRLAEQALAADGGLVRAHLVRGEVHLAEGEPAQAVESFVQAKRRDPSAWSAYSGLGRAYTALGRDADADAQFLEVLELAPRLSEPRVEYARALLERGELDRAIEQLGDAVDATPDDAELRRLLGLALAESGFGDGAITQLERSLALGLEDAPTRLLLGLFEEARERPVPALAHLDRALELDPELARAHAVRGSLLMDLGRYDEAREALERAVELDDEAPFPHLALGALCMEFLGEPQAATQHLRRYRQLGGDDPRAGEWLIRRVR